MFTVRYVLHSTFCPHSEFMCFVWIWEQTAIISLYSINWLVFITETECVYCAVGLGVYIWFKLISLFNRLGSFNKLQVYSIVKLNTDNKVCVNSMKICAQWGHVRYAEYVHTTQLHTAQHFWCANRLLFVYVTNCNPDSSTYTKGRIHIRHTQLYSTLKDLTVARTKPSSAGARKKKYTIVHLKWFWPCIVVIMWK